MEKITAYKSLDGKLFETHEECWEYNQKKIRIYDLNYIFDGEIINSCEDISNLIYDNQEKIIDILTRPF